MGVKEPEPLFSKRIKLDILPQVVNLKARFSYTLPSNMIKSRFTMAPDMEAII
jgi:hypothetical protein